ncbi:hypothetical protein HDV00_004912 [Rhizophlyctis rosea]|nr:hypothetical protein HDV00_004912 [Rhizophlyctis rosea]
MFFNIEKPDMPNNSSFNIEKPDKADVGPAEAKILGVTSSPSETHKLTTTMPSEDSNPTTSRPLAPPPAAPSPAKNYLGEETTPNTSNAMGPHGDIPAQPQPAHAAPQSQGPPQVTTKRKGGVEPLPIWDVPGSPHPGGLAIMDDGDEEGWPAGRSKM